MNRNNAGLRSKAVKLIGSLVLAFSIIHVRGSDRIDLELDIFCEKCSFAFCVTIAENGRRVTVETLKGAKLAEDDPLVVRALSVVRVIKRRDKSRVVTGAFGYVTKKRPDRLSVQVIEDSGNLSGLKKNITAVRSAFAKLQKRG